MGGGDRADSEGIPSGDNRDTPGPLCRAPCGKLGRWNVRCGGVLAGRRPRSSECFTRDGSRPRSDRPPRRTRDDRRTGRAGAVPESVSLTAHPGTGLAEQSTEVCPDRGRSAHRHVQTRARGYLPPLEAFEDAFDDIRFHLLATLAGMRAGLESMLKRLDPKRVRQLSDRRYPGFLARFGAKRRYWDRYVDSSRR